MKEITNISLLEAPFTLYFGYNKLPIGHIYDNSKKFQNDLKYYKIGNKSYSINFIKINEYECEMSIYLNNSFEYSINLFFIPLKLNLEDLNLNTKNILLYSPIQIKQLIHYYSSDYIFLEQDKNNIDENVDYKSLKAIIINKKEEFELENENILKTRKKAIEFFKTIHSNYQNEIIDIYSLLLSFNFYNIFSAHLKEQTFKLILNQNRRQFIENIKNFLNSSKRFLWIVGPEGIGKTISLMYFSLMNNENIDNNEYIFYVNLKFLQKNSCKIKEYLTNDLIKPFYLRKENIENEKSFKNIKNLLYYILKETFYLSKENKKLEPIYKFWIYLENALKIIDMCFCCKSLTIILDQYKDNTFYEYNYSYFNNFINYIHKNSYKLIISTSINNSKNQSNFYDNIDYFYSNFNGKNDIDNDYSDYENIKMINEEYDVIEECNFYQDILNKNIENKINLNKININVSINSNFGLNNKYKDDTLKIYYSSLVSGKDLIKKFQRRRNYLF